jgi:biotin carboxyl carrier protein
MKMEAAITATVDGTVRWTALDGIAGVEAGDLLLVIDPGADVGT